MNNPTPAAQALLHSVATIKQGLDEGSITKPRPQARLIAVSVVDAEEGMGVIQKAEAPKPKARRRDEEKTHVTNTAFRDNEALRELQRSLHRQANKRGKA